MENGSKRRIVILAGGLLAFAGGFFAGELRTSELVSEAQRSVNGHIRSLRERVERQHEEVCGKFRTDHPITRGEFEAEMRKGREEHFRRLSGLQDELKNLQDQFRRAQDACRQAERAEILGNVRKEREEQARQLRELQDVLRHLRSLKST